MSLSLLVDLPPHLLMADGPAPAEQRILLTNITWAGYEAMVDHWAERRVRISYLEGLVELMSPGIRHEGPTNLLGRMVLILTEELDIPMQALRSTTLKRPDLLRAAEADES